RALKLDVPCALIKRVLVRFHDDVRLHAILADRRVVGREPLGVGYAELPVVGEVVDKLHRALAEGRLSDQDAAPVVLNSGGDDLGGAGAVLVDQHNEWYFLRQVAAADAELLDLTRYRPLGEHERARQEQVGDAHRLIEEAAG